MNIKVNNHFKKIFFLFKAIGVQFKQWFLDYWSTLPRYKQIIAIVGSILIVIIAVRILPGKDVVVETEAAAKSVTLAYVSDLSNNSAALPLSGVVTSVNEAVIRAESSGQLTRVYRKLGDRVSAGQVIGEFDNAGERAAVLQAQGAYESAKAARDISLINSQSTTVSLDDVKTNTINSINSAYTTIDNIIRTNTDTAFIDPRTQNPRFKPLVPDSVLVNRIENQRQEIENLLIKREAKNRTLNNNSDLILELAEMQADLQKVKTYLDDLGLAYIKALPNDDFNQQSIDAQKAVVGGARATVSGNITALTGSKTSLQNSLTAQQISGSATTNNPSNAAAEASVKTALGAYNGALARLEKTVLRSPISGTLNSLTIQTGDFVNQSTQVAVVSNNGALEVLAYVSAEDSKRISVGANVKINNTTKGIVTRVAGAIDPSTNKIEVRVGILEDNKELINGQSVRLEISNAQNANTGISVTPKNSIIKIPLSAVKITPRGSYVFTLSATSSLVQVNIETGTLLGAEVQVVSGLTGDEQIVRDARGLKTGEVVEVKI